jgi:hypothetical protein
LFGHEIELLPRVLVLDHAEHAWRPDAVIRVMPVEPRPASGTSRSDQR